MPEKKKRASRLPGPMRIRLAIVVTEDLIAWARSTPAGETLDRAYLEELIAGELAQRLPELEDLGKRVRLREKRRQLEEEIEQLERAIGERPTSGGADPFADLAAGDETVGPV